MEMDEVDYHSLSLHLARAWHQFISRAAGGTSCCLMAEMKKPSKVHNDDPKRYGMKQAGARGDVVMKGSGGGYEDTTHH